MENTFYETSIVMIKHVTKEKVKTKVYINGGKRVETSKETVLSNYLDPIFLNKSIENKEFHFSNQLDQWIINFQRKSKQYKIDIELFIFVKISKIKIGKGNICDERKTEYLRVIVKSDIRVVYEDYPMDCLRTDYLFVVIEQKIAELTELSKLKIVPIDCISPVIFSPGTGGYLIHEVVGHMLESDNLKKMDKGLSEQLTIGKQVSQESLNISDSVSGFETLLGLNQFDDEGNDLIEKNLVTNGRISDNIDGNGCSRRTDFKSTSIPRMRATYIHSNLNLTLQEMVRLYPKTIVIDQILGGGIDVRTGSYQLVSNGRVFKKGEPENRFESLMIASDPINTLKDLEYIGDDLKYQHSYCVKQDQMIDIVVGSPTISIGTMKLRGI